MNNPQDHIPVRVTVSEAAKLFGVTERTVRAAIKRGDVQYVVVLGRYRINFDGLLSWSQKSTRRRNQRDSKGIGRYVGQWRIKNKKFSPNPRLLEE
ncbi:MAG: helix-turn-helix domain-containing protein [Candidatus Sungbacteria bacterium]|nr:helix-turn-helix domain-containing protein [Candidatus Sungbacteria bacterium]